MPTLAFSSKEEDLIKSLEIIYLKPDLRTSFDFAKVEDGIARISVWRDLPPNPQPDRVECTAYQWLLSGRGEKLGEGAKEVFQKFQDLKAIQLNLVEVEHKTQSTDGRGKLQKVEEARSLVKITIDRESALSLKPTSQELKKELRSSLQKCLELGRSVTKDKEVSVQ